MMLKVFVRLGWGLIVCARVLAILLLTLNLDFLKPQLEERTTALFQQKVRISGAIKPGLLGRRPAIVMHDVIIGADIKADTVAVALRGSQRFLIHAGGLKFGSYLLGDYDIPISVQPE